MQLLILTVIAFAIIMAGMAVGVIVSNRELRGSCGGPPALGPDGEPMVCPDCNCKVDLEAPVAPSSPRGR